MTPFPRAPQRSTLLVPQTKPIPAEMEEQSTHSWGQPLCTVALYEGIREGGAVVWDVQEGVQEHELCSCGETLAARRGSLQGPDWVGVCEA